MRSATYVSPIPPLLMRWSRSNWPSRIGISEIVRASRRRHGSSEGGPEGGPERRGRGAARRIEDHRRRRCAVERRHIHGERVGEREGPAGRIDDVDVGRLSSAQAERPRDRRRRPVRHAEQLGRERSAGTRGHDGVPPRVGRLRILDGDALLGGSRVRHDPGRGPSARTRCRMTGPW
jgi:hypothetical protein